MKKLTALMLAGLLLISCNSGTTVDPVTGETIRKPDKITQSDNDTTAETEEIVTRTTHLTGIFEKEVLPRLGDNYYSNLYPTVYNADGSFRIYGKFGKGDNRKWAIADIAADGEITQTLPIERYNNNNIWQMTASEDTVYYTQRNTDSAFSGKLGAYITACGAHHTGKMLNVSSNFADTESYGFDMLALRLDGDGNVYLCTANEVAVFDPDLNLKFMLKPDGGITAMNTALDGTVYIAAGAEDSYGLYPIDTEKKALSTPHLLKGMHIENLFFGDGYDFYYTDYENAVYGVNYSEDETKPPKITVVLNYNNSSVDHSAFTLLNVTDAQTMVVSEKFYNGNQEKVPVLFRKAPDRPLEDITVIEVAYTTSDYYFNADVMEFNRTHSDIMIVLQDYSRFNNDIDPDAGEKRLAIDVATGVYRPDIVFGTYDQQFIQTNVDSGSYVDLNTYLVSDPVVSTDTIFPSVLYSYSTDDGKVWGLPLDFEVQTLVSNNAVTGGLTQWNFTELMDYISTLSPDVSVMAHLSRANVLEYLMGNNACSAFVDMQNGTCSFDTPEFTQLLEFIRSLPKEPRYDTGENEYLARHNGKISLYRHAFHEITDWLSLEAIYNSKDYSLIGFPVNNGSEDKGAQLNFTESYTILSTSEHPDEAWEFIRFMLSDLYVFTHFEIARNLPILTEKCRAMSTSAPRSIYDFQYEMGGFSHKTAFNDEAYQITLETPPREPGIRVIPTTEMTDAFIDYLSNNVGQRIVNRIPDAITKIVSEEIETYLTGVKDAKSCANVIQSRVNIWLAEHE